MSFHPPQPVNAILSDFSGPGVNAVPVLALNEREAAKALSISEPHLARLRQRGEVPHQRLGERVVYFVDGLKSWLDRITETGAPENGESDQPG